MSLGSIWTGKRHKPLPHQDVSDIRYNFTVELAKAMHWELHVVMLKAVIMRVVMLGVVILIN